MKMTFTYFLTKIKAFIHKTWVSMFNLSIKDKNTQNESYSSLPFILSLHEYCL